VCLCLCAATCSFMHECPAISCCVVRAALILSAHALSLCCVLPRCLFFVFVCILRRVRELLCTKWLVQDFLPFNFFTTDMCRQMIGYETAGNTPYPPLPPRRMKHLVVEMFVATKKVSLGDFDFVFFSLRRWSRPENETKNNKIICIIVIIIAQYMPTLLSKLKIKNTSRKTRMQIKIKNSFHEFRSFLHKRSGLSAT